MRNMGGETRSVYLVACCRTAIGALNGSLRHVSAGELGAAVVREVLRRSGTAPRLVEALVLGSASAAGPAHILAGQVAEKAGFSPSARIAGMADGSGINALLRGARSIRTGAAQLVAAGGAGNSSAAGRGAIPLRQETCAGNAHCEKQRVPRAAWEDVVLASREKAQAAGLADRFRPEIVPAVPVDGGLLRMLETDEYLTMAAHQLPAGCNGDGMSMEPPGDGAAAALLASGAAVCRYGLTPMARLLSWGQAGVPAEVSGDSMVLACRQSLRKAGLTADDIDLAEFGESFPPQTVAAVRSLGFGLERVNVNGGGIALGAPAGCGGLRMIVTLLHALRGRAYAKRGMAALNTGTGQSLAVVFETC